MTRKVHPIVLAELFGYPGNARFLSIYARECGKAVDTLIDVIQLSADRNQSTLPNSFGLADDDEALLVELQNLMDRAVRVWV